MKTTTPARAAVACRTLVLFCCCGLILVAAQDFNRQQTQQHAQQSSYARVQYANNNTTRRFNIQRDPTIQYVTFDELYNKYNNQEKNTNVNDDNNNKKKDDVVVESPSPPAKTSNSELEAVATHPPPLASSTAVDSAINNVHRRWEDVPDLGNGWTVETTTTTTTSAPPPAHLAASSGNPKGANHMYAYSSAYQNSNNEFESVDRDGTISTENVANVPTSTTSRTTSSRVTTTDGTAEYAHAVGGEEIYLERTTTSTVQPAVMEASWNENKSPKIVERPRRPPPPPPPPPSAAAVAAERDHVSNSDRHDPPSGKVNNGAGRKPTSSADPSSKFSTQEVHVALGGDGDQSNWRPFMGPSPPQVVNPAIVRKPQQQTTPTPPPTFMLTSTGDTLFYDEAKNKLMIIPSSSSNNKNMNGNQTTIIPVGIIVNDSPSDTVRRNQNQHHLHQHPLVPVPSSSQRPDAVQILVIPNLIENEVKTTASSGPQFQQPSNSMQVDNVGTSIRFPPEIGQQGRPHFAGGPSTRPSDLQQQQQQQQQRPPPPPLQFGQRNPQEQHQPRPGSPLSSASNQFNQQNNLQPRPSSSSMFIRPHQQEGQFLSANHQNQPRPEGPPAPNRFNVNNVGAAQMNDERFIAGIPGPRGPHRIPSGPVGLPPQLVPQLQHERRPTNAPPPPQQQQQQGPPADMITGVPRPRPSGVASGLVGSSIDNPLPGPPIPLPGVPSGPIVIANLPNNNNNNHGMPNTQDRNGPNGSPMFRPNFNRLDVVPDRSDADVVQNHDNFIHQQEQPQFSGAQQMMMNQPPMNNNFQRPPNFPMPPRGPQPGQHMGPGYMQQQHQHQQQQQHHQHQQTTSSPSLIKSLFSRFFPFGRSLDTDESVPIIDSDTVANWTALGLLDDEHLFDNDSQSNSTTTTTIIITDLRNVTSSTTTLSNDKDNSSSTFRPTARPIITNLTTVTSLTTSNNNSSIL